MQRLRLPPFLWAGTGMVGTVISVAALTGYLIGSLPTANAIARLWGVDLRAGGSQNPGTNNARRLGGYPLAALVLTVELSKGILAFLVGFLIGGEMGGAWAGVGAIAGNVYNFWYGFKGGKGLAITGGVVLAAWPTALPALLAVLALGFVITRASGRATLITVALVIPIALAWATFDWPLGWGVETDAALYVVSFGMACLLGPRHIHDARYPLRAPSRP